MQSSIHSPFPHIQTTQKRQFPYLTLVQFATCGMNVMSIWQLVVGTPTIHGVNFTEHARNSLACLVPDCGEDFDIKCLTAWGIRPSHGEHVRTPTKIALNNISTQSGEHTLHIFVVFYVFISCLLKYITYIPLQTRCCTN